MRICRDLSYGEQVWGENWSRINEGRGGWVWAERTRQVEGLLAECGWSVRGEDAELRGWRGQQVRKAEELQC